LYKDGVRWTAERFFSLQKKWVHGPETVIPTTIVSREDYYHEQQYCPHPKSDFLQNRLILYYRIHTLSS
jgi:hypothetical protein